MYEINDSDDEDELAVEEEEEDEDRGQTVLVPAGPHKWTTSTLREFVKEYRHLEGKLFIHPRTRRLYEVSTVFYHEEMKTAAAYIRVMDGGQTDPIDQHPNRIDGKGGIAELVSAFEASGGSNGNSRTPWPTSEEEWVMAQRQDPKLGPIISTLEAEQDKLKERLLTTSEEAQSPDFDFSPYVKVGTRHEGADLVLDGVLLMEPRSNQKVHSDCLYVVPESLKRNVMELYHDSKGHPGAARTKETIFLRYWWKGMSADVENHVKGCKACARRKARNAVATVPL